MKSSLRSVNNRTIRFTVVFLVVLSSSQRLCAQAMNTEGATVSGVAVDSVRGGFLRGAIVRIAGQGLNSTTDSAGRFRIQNIPAGEYRLEVIHPLLDTLGIFLQTPEREAKPGDSSFIILAIPSPSTLAERKCSAADRKLGSAMILGTVFDADTEDPSVGAKVWIDWTDYALGGKSVRATPQIRSSIVGSDGRFRICGVPDDLVAGVTTARGRDTTAALQVNLTAGLAIVSFHLSRDDSLARSDSPGNAARRVTTATIEGHAVDDKGIPLKGVRISSEVDSVNTMSHDDGSFRLAGIRPGTRAIVARKLGFEPVTLHVESRAQGVSTANIVLSKFVPVLETVRVTALRELGLQRVGFAARKATGMGNYLTPEDIQRRNSPWLLDLLRTTPGLRFGRTADGQAYVTGRFGGCVRYFVDGHLWTSLGDGPDTFLAGGELGAIEVYAPNFSPAEYMSFAMNGGTCTSVVMDEMETPHLKHVSWPLRKPINAPDADM